MKGHPTHQRKTNDKTTLPSKDTTTLKSKLASNTVKPTKINKMAELKSKIDIEKNLMRKSGRRFKEAETCKEDFNNLKNNQCPIAIQATQQLHKNPLQRTKFHQGNQIESSQKQSSDSVSFQKNKCPKKESPKCKQLEIQTQKSERMTMNLSELQIMEGNMGSSRVLSQEVKAQQIRNQSMKQFLEQVNLGKFFIPIIQLGYDQIQTLMEITGEELNHLMMRAKQQEILTKAIQAYRQKHKELHKQIQSPQRVISDSSSMFKAKTIPWKAPHSSRSWLADGGQQAPSFMFLSSLGSQKWSCESQVRRACSSCFQVKIATQLKKYLDCHYCQKCYDYLQPDCLSASLSTKMHRSYHN